MKVSSLMRPNRSALGSETRHSHGRSANESSTKRSEYENKRRAINEVREQAQRSDIATPVVTNGTNNTPSNGNNTKGKEAP